MTALTVASYHLQTSTPAPEPVAKDTATETPSKKVSLKEKVDKKAHKKEKKDKEASGAKEGFFARLLHSISPSGDKQAAKEQEKKDAAAKVR